MIVKVHQDVNLDALFFVNITLITACFFKRCIF